MIAPSRRTASLSGWTVPRPNVIVQVKNGPDFQPREPFHPLFGAMPRTPLMMELQITKEYLGFATHLVYLGTLYEEVLQADTHARGGLHGCPRDRWLAGGPRTDRYCRRRQHRRGPHLGGSHFDQANWYAFGRLAWNPQQSARDCRRLGSVDVLARPAGDRPDRADDDGLARGGSGLHDAAGPAPPDGTRPSLRPAPGWTEAHVRTGRRCTTTAQTARASVLTAAPAEATPWASTPAGRRGLWRPRAVPESLLLWFHHVPWDHRMRSGRTLWDELVGRYSRGVRQVRSMQDTWAGLRDRIDPQRHRHVTAFLQIQHDEAQWWRDASVAYFSQRTAIARRRTATAAAIVVLPGVAVSVRTGDGR